MPRCHIRRSIFYLLVCGFSLSLVFLLQSPLWSATRARVELANGDRVSGVLWQITDHSLLVDAVYGAYRIPLAMVKGIFIEGESPPARVILLGGKSLTGTPLGGDGKGFQIRVDGQDLRLEWSGVDRMEFDLPLPLPAEKMSQAAP